MHIRYLKYFTRLCLLTVFLLASHSNLMAANAVTVVMKTSAGDMRIELYPQAAP